MRSLMMAAAVAALTAAPVFAQESAAPGGQDARGYVLGLGGFSASVGNTTGVVVVEGGARIAPHTMIIGSIGRFANLLGDLQPTLDQTTSSLENNQDLSVVGGGNLPATYYTGGVRVEIPAAHHILPYFLGTMGVAHLSPSAQFTFSSGTMPDGSTPAVGTDVTSALLSSGGFTQPSTSNAFMFTFGGGVQIPVIPHWVLDAGYRYSRIAADTSLSASALNANGMTFGFGYRF